MKHSSENPLAFWDKEEYMITLPSVLDDNPTKASHPRMSLAHTQSFADKRLRVSLLKNSLSQVPLTGVVKHSMSTDTLNKKEARKGW